MGGSSHFSRARMSRDFLLSTLLTSSFSLDSPASNRRAAKFIYSFETYMNAVTIAQMGRMESTCLGGRYWGVGQLLSSRLLGGRAEIVNSLSVSRMSSSPEKIFRAFIRRMQIFS